MGFRRMNAGASRSQSKQNATGDGGPVKADPRLVMAVMAVGMIVGALFSAGKPAGPVVDLTLRSANAATSK